MDQCDSLISARWVAPVVPQRTVLENHCVAIRDGRILGLCPEQDARRRYHPRRSIERPHHLLIPGLINAHTHAAMTLFRGFADDMALDRWLNDRIWPTESRFVTPTLVADGTRLAIAEMLAGGITTFSDMYYFPDAAASVAAEHRIRAVIGLILVDFPTPWAADTDEYFNKAIAVHDQFSSHPLVTTQFAPHSTYAVSDTNLKRMRILADQIEARTHIHLHETEAETAESVQAHGLRPLARLRKAGLVNTMLSAVHAVDLDAGEMAELARAAASIVHCPESNAKLASGIAPVVEMLAAGVNVALGTDGAASNNDLNLIGEMRSAALLAKLSTGKADALPAYRCLEMATLNGAISVGLEAETGSLEVGKAADIACIDLHRPNTWPVYEPVSQLVYSAEPAQVTDTWVNGEPVYFEGRHRSLDLAAVLAEASPWQKRFSESKSN